MAMATAGGGSGAAIATSDIIISCLDSIRSISAEHIEGGSIVYLDGGCTESFQFLGAYSLLLELGASSICSLENMSPLDMVASLDPPRKVVIFTSRVLSDAHRYILRCLSTHQNISQCAVFTAISEAAHSAHPDSPLGPDAFHEYEILLVQDYEELFKRSQNSTQSEKNKVLENTEIEDKGLSEPIPDKDDIYSTDAVAYLKGSHKDDPVVHEEPFTHRLVVSVYHFPMILCPLSPRVFVLPSEGSVAEAYLSSSQDEGSLSPQLPSHSTGSHPDGEDGPPGAILTAQFLYHLAAKMDLKMEIYSLGDLSRTVGKLMTDMSSLYDVGRRKRSAGLLLIDRTLDLLTPCSHGDSLVDRIFSALPRREQTASYVLTKSSQTRVNNDLRVALDVQIPLENILSEKGSTNKNHHVLERIDDFLHGWDSSDSAFKAGRAINLEKNSQFDSKLLHGSFVSSESFRGAPYLEAILDRRAKDGALLARKWLQEALRRDNINVNVKLRPGFTTKSDFDALIRALARSQSSLIKHKGIIQVAVATSYALDEKHVSKWDAFSSAEKMLHVSAGDTSQSLAAQITDLINKSALVGLHGNKTESSQGLLSYQDVMLLTAFGYILAGEVFPTSGSGGPFSWQEEYFMKEAIVDVIMDNPGIANLKVFHDLKEQLQANFDKTKLGKENKENTSSLEKDDIDDDDEWGNWGDDDAAEDIKKEQVYGDMQLKLELRDRVDNLFKFFHKLSSLKKKNLPLKGALGNESNFIDDLHSSKGLIYKLLNRVLEKHDIAGLEYHSSTVGRIFKSGFGRFGLGQAKPHLGDQNVILVFVIGGINGVEVREAREALSESGRPDIELIFGGTTLLTPDNMYNLLLGDSSYS